MYGHVRKSLKIFNIFRDIWTSLEIIGHLRKSSKNLRKLKTHLTKEKLAGI